MKATLRFDRLILEGSLPRYHGGASLGLSETEEAISRLEEEVGVRLDQAEVWRLDVFADVTLSEPVGTYLPYLIAGPRYERVAWGQKGLRFELKCRHLVFYDKVAELRDKNRAVLPQYEGLNVLRYEMQLRKRVKRQLGYDQLHVADVLTRGFRDDLSLRWHEEYRSIDKLRRTTGLVNTQNLRRSLACAGLALVGRDCLEEQLHTEYQVGALTTSQYYRHVRWIRSLNADEELTEPSACVDELDGAIDEAATLMRQA